MRPLLIILLSVLTLMGRAQTETSVAGFILLSASGRHVYNFNPGWRYLKGDAAGAEAIRFEDSH